MAHVRSADGQHALSCRISAVPCHLVDLLDKCRVDSGVDNGLHHREMLEVIVRLKQGVAGEKFHQNAADAPDVARERPSQPENNFGCPVMAGRHNR